MMSDIIDPVANLSGNDNSVDNGSDQQSLETGKWVDQLSKEYRSDESLKGKAKLDDLFKDYKDRGTKLADLESKVKSFATPKDPSEYELSKDLDSRTSDLYRTSFMEAGIPKELAGKFTTTLLKKAGEISESFKAEQSKAEAKAEAEIRQEWGAEHSANMDTIRNAVSKLFPVETMKKMESMGLLKDKGFLNGLLPVGRSVSEGKFVKGGMSNEEKDPLANFYPSMQKKSQ